MIRVRLGIGITSLFPA